MSSISDTAASPPTRTASPNVLNIYLVASILVSATFASAGMIGAAWFAGLAAMMAVNWLGRPVLEVPEVAAVRLTALDYGATALAAAPAILYLAQTWKQEFPYLGDQDEHIGFSLEAFKFWGWRWLVAVALLTCLIRFRARWWIPFTVLVLCLYVGLTQDELFAFSSRYPGTVHFFAVPFHAAARLFAWPWPTNALRVVNVLSIPAWLLVLRPLLLGRRPTGPILPVAVFILWQKDFIYYFTSAYIEAWSVVLVLLAAEHAIVFGRRAAWRTFLILGAAALTKDQAVFAMPMFVLALFPWKGSLREWVRYAWFAAVALAPFIIYYRLRRLAAVWRTVSVVSWGEIVDPVRFGVFVDRLTMQFQTALPLLLMLAAVCIVFCFRRSQYLLAFIGITLTIASNLGLFYVDRIQQFWTGYFRTEMIPFALIGLALLPLIGFANDRRRTAIALLVAVGGNAISLASAFALTTRPDVTRNFVEHVEAPIFYPIRDGISRGESSGFILPGDRIRVLNNAKNFWAWFYLGPFDGQYPDLAKRFRMSSENFHGLVESRCRCREGEKMLAVFVYFTNQGATNPVRIATEAEAAACEAKVLQTCRNVETIDYRGRTLGLLAAGPK